MLELIGLPILFFRPVHKKKEKKNSGSARNEPAGHMGLVGAEPLSVHYREREVLAALWNQPDALSSTFSNHQIRAFAQTRQQTLSLDRAAQKPAKPDPTRGPNQCSTILLSPHGSQALVT